MKKMIITDDISQIMQGYGSAPWFGTVLKTMPPEFAKTYTEGIANILSPYFDVSVIPGEEIVRGLTQLVCGTMPKTDVVISCEPAYITKASMPTKEVVQLDLSMAMGLNPNEKVIGGSSDNKVVPRWGSVRAGRDVRDIWVEAAGASYFRSAVIADEVTFTGETIYKAKYSIRGVATFDVNIDKAATYIATTEAKEFLASKGIELYSVLTYDLGASGELFDTLDARDLTLLPQGGRTVEVDGRIMKQPRFNPFGSARARFGDDVDETAIAKSALDLNIKLFQELEEINGRAISTLELAEPIFNLPYNKSVANALKEIRGR